MKKDKLLVGVLFLFICVLFVGCSGQKLVSSMSSAINSEGVPSEIISSSILQSSKAEPSGREIVLFTYNGLAPSPTAEHKPAKLPQDTKEIQETVRIFPDEVTPDTVMKLYAEKYLSTPVGNRSMNFSYSSASMNGNGIVTIDFTKDGARYLSYGSMLEMNSLYGIAKTMLTNIEGAKSVCYGIEGADYATEMFLERDVPFLKN